MSWWPFKKPARTFPPYAYVRFETQEEARLWYDSLARHQRLIDEVVAHASDTDFVVVRDILAYLRYRLWSLPRDWEWYERILELSLAGIRQYQARRSLATVGADTAIVMAAALHTARDLAIATVHTEETAAFPSHHWLFPGPALFPWLMRWRTVDAWPTYETVIDKPFEAPVQHRAVLAQWLLPQGAWWQMNLEWSLAVWDFVMAAVPNTKLHRLLGLAPADSLGGRFFEALRLAIADNQVRVNEPRGQVFVTQDKTFIACPRSIDIAMGNWCKVTAVQQSLWANGEVFGQAQVTHEKLKSPVTLSGLWVENAAFWGGETPGLFDGNLDAVEG